MDNNGDLEVIKVISEDEYAKHAAEEATATEQRIRERLRDLPPDAAVRSIEEVREQVWAERLCTDPDDPANA